MGIARVPLHSPSGDPRPTGSPLTPRRPLGLIRRRVPVLCPLGGRRGRPRGDRLDLRKPPEPGGRRRHQDRSEADLSAQQVKKYKGKKEIETEKNGKRYILRT